ncbi:hypothetical protein PVL29_008716 [Vitis rotundifolia]|uniref:Uncharacterized protein n=1 Tax=Vitis rotundifolia TaxID=103349 RepID=A0AA39DUJ6_VITRO|nr:hypothetical protein PVL29_008716 [Vitis rotundifolia]
MGNYMSCYSFQPSTPKTAKLFDAHGNLRRVKVPVTAAELMLEEPGYVVSRVDDLRRTRRIPAMRADDVLLEGKAYLMMPVSRVHCVVSEVEMALIAAASKRRSKKRGGSRVLPAGNEGTTENLEVQSRVLGGDGGGGGDVGFFGRHRLGNFRQWSPVLETISEGS